MRKHLLAAILVGAGIGLAPPQARATVSATLNEFTGNDASINLTIDQAGSDLNFALTLTTPAAGDITGFWANVADSVNLSSLQVLSSSATVVTLKTGTVNDLGGGVNLHGGGSPAPLDFGLRFDKPGDGSQTSVNFTLHSSAGALSESDFLGQTFAARVQAIPTGEGSSKLVSGETPPPGQSVPDGSSTATLLGLSLCGVEWLRRKLVK